MEITKVATYRLQDMDSFRIKHDEITNLRIVMTIELSIDKKRQDDNILEQLMYIYGNIKVADYIDYMKIEIDSQLIHINNFELRKEEQTKFVKTSFGLLCTVSFTHDILKNDMYNYSNLNITIGKRHIITKDLGFFNITNTISRLDVIYNLLDETKEKEKELVINYTNVEKFTFANDMLAQGRLKFNVSIFTHPNIRKIVYSEDNYNDYIILDKIRNNHFQDTITLRNNSCQHRIIESNYFMHYDKKLILKRN